MKAKILSVLLFLTSLSFVYGQDNLNYVKSKLNSTFTFAIPDCELSLLTTGESLVKNYIDFTVTDANETSGKIYIEGIVRFNERLAGLSRTKISSTKYKATVKRILDDIEVIEIQCYKDIWNTYVIIYPKK